MHQRPTFRRRARRKAHGTRAALAQPSRRHGKSKQRPASERRGDQTAPGEDPQATAQPPSLTPKLRETPRRFRDGLREFRRGPRGCQGRALRVLSEGHGEARGFRSERGAPAELSGCEPTSRSLAGFFAPNSFSSHARRPPIPRIGPSCPLMPTLRGACSCMRHGHA